MSKAGVIFAVAALSGAAMTSCGANAATIVNGSFESGRFTDNTGQDTDNVSNGSTVITGWTAAAPLAWIGPNNPFGLAASNGSYFLDLTGYQDAPPFGGVQQTVSTTPGVTYTLTFDLGSSSTYGLQDGVTASAGSTSHVFTSTNDGSNTNEWQPETLTFTATDPSTVISFVGQSGDKYIGLDNVALAVPEPGAWAMMLLGVGMIGGGRRIARRKAQTALNAA